MLGYKRDKGTHSLNLSRPQEEGGLLMARLRMATLCGHATTVAGWTRGGVAICLAKEGTEVGVKGGVGPLGQCQPAGRRRQI